jgi:hypothetical protein
MNCTSAKLNMFSHKFNTYINQIFGDETVRDILSKSKSKPFIDGAELHINRQPTGFINNDNSVHHITKIHGKVCGEMQPIYQTNINGIKISDKENADVYCQSYSLMRAYGIHIPTNVYDKQMAMIQMYRDILSDKRIMNKLYNTLVVTSWFDKTITPNEPFETHDMKDKIPEGIIDTLNDWEKFGYLRVIGNGKCPKPVNRGRNRTIKNISHRSYSRNNKTRGISRSRNTRGISRSRNTRGISRSRYSSRSRK